MKNNHWTFLYVPSREGGVRTIHVNKRLVAAVAGACFAFVLLVGGLTISFARQSASLHRLEARDAEIALLRAQIGELESAASLYEHEMAETMQVQQRAHLLAGLGDGSPGEPNAGLGGRAPEPDPVGVAYDNLSERRLAELRSQLDRLLAQARQQREGFSRVLDVLREDQQLRDTTPSVRPLRGGWLSSRYGKRVDPFTGNIAFHRGLDFSADPGTPVYATASGTVVRASRHGSLGNLIEIDHGNGFVTRYGHMRGFAAKKGDRIERGDLIGYVGNTGRSTNPHLHYEVVRDGRSENPWLYIIRD